MGNNVVEILYTDACPFWKETMKMIDEVMKELNLAATVKKTRITSEEEAKRYGFPGSPTVRVNGVDIDPAARDMPSYIGCRIYTFKGRTYESPPKKMMTTGFKRLIKK